MSVNYNTALLRSLHETLTRSLDDIATRLAAGEPARRDPTATPLAAALGTGTGAGAGKDGPRTVLDLANQVAGSLSMVRCHAVARVAATLENAIKGLAEAERRGWTPVHAKKVSHAAIGVVHALKRQVRHMVREENVLPVTLWAPWDELNRAMGEPDFPPEALFEPNPQFDGQAFRNLDDEFLKDVVNGAIERFDAALVSWEKARDEGEAASAAKRILEVFDSLYTLQHRKAYYIYWLVWRARLTLAFLGEQSRLLSHRADWLQELDAASVEMRKFANACRAPQHARLMDVLAPIVRQPWPESWGVGHPVLVELDQRLGLTAFWEAAALARNVEVSQAKSTFLERREDIMKSVRQLIRAAHLAFDSNKPKDVRDLRVAAANVMSKEDGLPNADALPLFAGLRRIVAIIDAAGAAPVEAGARPRPVFGPEVSLEAAGLLILLEEVLDRPFPLSSEVKERLVRQHARLEAAWAGQPDALRSLPPVRWDGAYREQKGREAVVQALSVLQGDLAEIETAWLEVERNESDTPDAALQSASEKLMLGSGVLLLLRYPAAAAIARELAVRLPRFKPGRSSDADRASLVSGLAALSGYVTARHAGQNGAGALLQDAASALRLAIAPLIEEEVADDPENLAFTTAPEAQVTRRRPPERAEGDLPDADLSDVGLSGGSPSPASEESAATESVPADFDADEGVSEDGFAEGLFVEESAAHPDDIGAMEESGETEARGPASDLPPSSLTSGDPMHAAPVDAVSSTDEVFDLFGDGEVAASPPSLESPPNPAVLLSEAPPVSSPAARVSAPWHQGPLPALPSAEELPERLRAGSVIDRFKDRDIALCFIDEVESVLEQMATARDVLAEQPYEAEAWADLRRGYHTLKGSGRMAGYFAIGEVAYWGEKTLNDRIARQVGMTPEADDLLGRAEAIFDGWLQELKAHQRAQVDGRELAEIFAALAREAQAAVPVIPGEEEAPPEVSDLTADDTGLPEEPLDDEVFTPEERRRLIETGTLDEPPSTSTPAQDIAVQEFAVQEFAVQEIAVQEIVVQESGGLSGAAASEDSEPVGGEDSAEDAAWDEVFDAIEEVGAGLNRLTRAIVRLRQEQE